MKVSIALCTYEGARHLNDQLASIGGQSRLPDEVVIHDDGSRDETARILREFASNSPFPVHVEINHRQLGPMQNFEHAIRHCSGEVIALADQDDVWHPEKIARLEAALISSPEAGLVFSDANVVDQYGRSLGYRAWEVLRFGQREQRLFRRGKAFRCLLWQEFVMGASMAFRSSFRSLILPFPTLSGASGSAVLHDAWIALAISAVAEITFVDDPLIEYRQHSGQHCGLPAPKQAPRRLLPLRPSSSKNQRKSLVLQDLTRLRAIHNVLRGRTSGLDCSRALFELQACERHLSARVALLERERPRGRVALQELVSLRYHRHSRGLRSALGDLLAPEA
ncbi:MAG: glycosyltransferase family 2 protein [bacterium]